MGFEHRSYNSGLFRPHPEISYQESPHLLIAATPWGARSSAERVIHTIQEYFQSTQNDAEVTSPFDRMSCLSRVANNLRIAALLANDWLYREENKSEYVSGVELFAGAVFDQEAVFVQSGHPQVFLQRQGRDLVPLAGTIDLTFDLSPPSLMLPPLPNQLLGLDPSVNLTIHSFRPQPGDQLVLVSRSSIPASFFAQGPERKQMDHVVRLLAKDNNEQPFWIGLWDLA